MGYTSERSKEFRQLFAPPLELARLVGNPDLDGFFNVGRKFIGHFRDFAGLRASDHVLDIGCGCGRMALPLLQYLDATGRYDGLDIHPACIAWAAETITPAYPNFHFHVADVRNLTYNPAGAIAPERYVLPFADASFDFVLLTSVFTHMLPETQVHYLYEIYRVLKVGGRGLATFFLLNDASKAGIRAGRSHFRFPYRWGTCAVEVASHPEDVVAYEEATIRQRLAAAGLEILRPPLFGFWSGRSDSVDFQDMVVFRKPRSLRLSRRLLGVWRRLTTRPQEPVFEPTRW
jgi:ubiquinone/menaquinone biosynthesis C-methylase UbiE